MNLSIKSVGLFPHKNKPLSIKKAVETAKILESKGVIIKAPEWLDLNQKSFDIYDSVDAIIAFGGDGTVLRTAKKACLSNIPILSINTGKIGYLTTLEENEFFDADAFSHTRRSC